MKTIIAPTDFTPVSLNAVKYAADISKFIRTKLLIVHVCQIPVAISDVPVPETDISSIMSTATNKLNLLRKELIERTNHKVPISIDVKLGAVVPEIISISKNIDLYAVVMGSETEFALERVLLGGKTFNAMDNITAPVIIIPSDSRFNGIKKICLACDLEDVLSTIPVQEITKLVKEYNAEFHVVNVIKEESYKLSVEKVNESILIQKLFTDIRPTYHYLTSNNAEQEIMQFVFNNNFDLLIVIPKKHTFFEKYFKKSHSKKIVLKANIPVLSLHD